MGLWGPAVFTIPLLAAWYSYEHLAADPPHLRPDHPRTRRRARARRHGARRARGARRRPRGRDGEHARASRVTSSTQLETAALLHHLGQVCLDEPDDGRPPEPVSVAQAGATILRGTQLLAPAGDIIAAEWMPYRQNVSSRPSVMSGQILKVAERVRRALRRSCRPCRSRARGAVLGAGVPLRRARARRARDGARSARPARRSALLSRSAGARRRAASTGDAAALEAEVDDPEPHHDVADRELLVREARAR